MLSVTRREMSFGMGFWWAALGRAWGLVLQGVQRPFRLAGHLWRLAPRETAFSIRRSSGPVAKASEVRLMGGGCGGGM